jgi:hypothetical protein
MADELIIKSSCIYDGKNWAIFKLHMEAYAYSKGWAGILNGTITAESFGNKSEFPKVARGSLSGLTYEKFYPEKGLDDYDEFDLLEDSNKFQKKIEIENSSEEIHENTKVLHEKAEKGLKVEKAEKVPNEKIIEIFPSSSLSLIILLTNLTNSDSVNLIVFFI